MSKKALWIGAALILCIVGVGVLGSLGYGQLQEYRGRGALLRAEQAYAEGDWRVAKSNYTWYLVRHPEDQEVLPRYIESCLKLLNNRQAALKDAGRAYLRLALATPSDRDLIRELVDFYKQRELWWELEYAADALLREHPDDPFLSYNKALANERVGRTTQALAIYRRLADSGYPESDLYGSLALLLQQEDNREQGWEVLEAALARQPNDPRIRVERARFLLADHDLTEAAQEIEIALEGGLDSGEALLTAAEVRAGLEDWENGRAYAKRALEKIPRSYEGYLLVVRSYLNDDRVDDAIAFLSNVDPYVLADNPRLYLLLAEIQIDAARLEEFDRTVEDFRIASPGSRVLFEYLAARKLLAKGLASDAASKLEVVVTQAPNLQLARYYLGLAYLKDGQYERSKNTFELYIDSNPQDERAQIIWEARFAIRSAPELESAAIDLLESDTPYFGRLLLSAHLLTHKRHGTDGDSERIVLAKRLFERAIEESPSSSESYRDLAFLCLDQGDVESARQVLMRAEASGVAPTELYLVRAALALAGDKFDQARMVFDDELALGAITTERSLRWAELFADKGYFETGMEVLQAAQAHLPEEEDRLALDLGQVHLHGRFGDFENARALAESLMNKYRDVPGMVQRLNDERMGIARALLAPGARRNESGALLLIADVESLEPSRTDTMLLRARLLLALNPPDLDGADTLLASAREAGSSEAETFLISSAIARGRGQFAKALDYAVSGKAASPDNRDMGIMLARAQLQMGWLSESTMTLENLQSLYPGNRTILDLLGRAYAGAGRFSEAEALLRQLEEGDDGQTVSSLRAWLLVARARWADAEQVLQAMHEDDPDDLWTIHFLAIAIAEQGQADRAEEFLNTCISRNSDDPDLWIELGRSHLAYADSARSSEASFAFTQALVHRPGYYRALRGLLAFQQHLGNPGAALGLCDVILAETPDDTDLLYQRAVILAQLPGRYLEALSAIERAIEITPRPAFIYQRGRLRLALGDAANAIEDFRRVEQAGGIASGSMNLLMAEAYLELGNNELARSFSDAARREGSNIKREELERLNRIVARLVEVENQ